MKTLLKITALSAILLGLVACNKEENVPFVILAQGDRYGGPDTFGQIIVIKTQEEWEREFLYQCYNELEIDFSRYQMIIIIDELRPDSRVSISGISSIVKSSNRLIVAMTEWRVVGDHCSFPGAEVQNYYIVKIPTTNKKIELRISIRTHRC